MLKPSEILQQRGWYQGGYVAEDGSVCAGRAIMLAIPGEGQQIELRQAIRDRVNAFLQGVVSCPKRHYGVMGYNDCDCMDLDTMLRALKHAEQEVGL